MIKSIKIILFWLFMLCIGNSTLLAQCGITVNAGNDTTICDGSNRVSLSGSVTVASGGVWIGRGGFFMDKDSTNLTATYIPSFAEVLAGSTFIVFETTGNGSCGAKRDTVNITIYKAPIPVISGAVTVCEGAQNINYSVAAFVNHTYDWHVVGGTIVSGQNSDEIAVDWDEDGPGYIYMVQTDTSGCQGVGAINTISRFDFNTPELIRASIGPDALSYDNDAHSNGIGYQITNDCGGSKGIDLEIPGAVFDRGKICMTYSWQRDESFADFFTRGGVTFRVRSGELEIGLEIDDGSGGSTLIGPLSTNYTIPNDDILRYFTFCYDSATGVGVAMQFDSIVWTYNGTPGRSLKWSGNAMVGEIMDGSCNGRTLLDWSNISIPITIVPKPEASIEGDSLICQYSITDYKIADPESYFTYNWSVDGGSITSGLATDSINVRWDSSGQRSVSVVVTDSINGCDTTLTFDVDVTQAPDSQIVGRDTICRNDTIIYAVASNQNYTYQWTASTGTIIGSSVNDSVYVSFSQSGSHNLAAVIVDSLTGCVTSTEKNIYVDSLPAINITGNNPVCEQTTNTYQIPQNSAYSYTWNVNGGTINSGAGTHSIEVGWTTTGTGTVEVAVEKSPSGCQTTIQYSVTIYTKPVTGDIQKQ